MHNGRCSWGNDLSSKNISFGQKSYFVLMKYILFCALFFFFVIFGTLSHEMAHIAIAKALSYKTILHYASMSYYRINPSEILQQSDEIKNRDDFLICLAGPLFTLLVSLLGFLVLAKKQRKEWFRIAGIFLCLFAARFVINPMVSISTFLMGQRDYPFGGDEYYMSLYLKFPPYLLSVFLMTIAIGLLLWLFAVYLNRKESFLLLIAGITAGGLAYYVWLIEFGKMFLP